MKKYKEYMDRISLGEEGHRKIMAALEEEAKRQAAGETSESSFEPERAPGKKSPWYKKDVYRQQSGYWAAMLLVGLLLSAAIFLPKGDRNLTITPTLSGKETTAAAMQTSPSASTTPTLAPTGAATPTLTPTGAATPTLAPTGAATPTLSAPTELASSEASQRSESESHALLAEIKLVKIGKNGRRQEVLLKEEDILMVMTWLGLGGAEQPGSPEAPWEATPFFAVQEEDIENAPYGIYLLAGDQKYVFRPEKADETATKSFEALLGRYGIK